MDKVCMFDCDGDQLVGIVSEPEHGVDVGIMIVVGGPQYRIGSHRQFVHLARYLSDAGFPVFRFDYRGMGDASGTLRGFAHIDADIQCAIDAFLNTTPSVKRVVLWGLCDGATASALYAYLDPRVEGLVLVNPWLRTAEGQASVQIKHYYLNRLLAPVFWRKLLSGRIDIRQAATEFFSKIMIVFRTRFRPREEKREKNCLDRSRPLPQLMGSGLALFKGHVLTVLSGNDYTADEFRTMSRQDLTLAQALQSVGAEVREVPHANHTFSSAAWRQQVAEITREWVQRFFK